MAKQKKSVVTLDQMMQMIGRLGSEIDSRQDRLLAIEMIEQKDEDLMDQVAVLKSIGDLLALIKIHEVKARKLLTSHLGHKG